MADQKRKLAAIVFTDIVGFTKLTAKDQTLASELLTKQRDLLKQVHPGPNLLDRFQRLLKSTRLSYNRWFGGWSPLSHRYILEFLIAYFHKKSCKSVISDSCE